MIAVQADFSRPIRPSTQNDSVVSCKELLRGTPGCVEIVFCSGAMEAGWPRLPVNIDHIVAFAVPVPIIGKSLIMNVQVASNVVLTSLGVEDHMVFLPRDIVSPEAEVLIRYCTVINALSQALTIPLCMETQFILVKLIILLIDVKVKLNSPFYLAFYFYASARGKRHWERAVESLSIPGLIIRGAEV